MQPRRASSDDAINPYHPPKTCPGASFFPGDEWSEVQASLLARSLAYRRILLTGGVLAEVEYNGRGLGFETVTVDGKLVSRCGAPWTLAPQHRFTLGAGNKQVPALIEVRGVIRIRGFRLWVDDRLVYVEGTL
jgi:hypothetical protein